MALAMMADVILLCFEKSGSPAIATANMRLFGSFSELP
jgi:hypothetical protein